MGWLIIILGYIVCIVYVRNIYTYIHIHTYIHYITLTLTLTFTLHYITLHYITYITHITYITYITYRHTHTHCTGTIYMYKYVYEIIIGTWKNHSACNEDIMGIHMAYLIGYITCESWEISGRTHGGTKMGIWYLNKQTRWGFPWGYIGIWWVCDTWTNPLVI